MAKALPTEPVRKSFNEVSATGLGVKKDGKLQLPFKFGCDYVDEAHNGYRQPYAKVGDFCVAALPSGTMTAGTVGKIIEAGTYKGEYRNRDGYFKIQLLDGTIGQSWAYGVATVTEAQAKEVRDYYFEKEKRPERIKHDFWKP